jgi:hypothetical protein
MTNSRTKCQPCAQSATGPCARRRFFQRAVQKRLPSQGPRAVGTGAPPAVPWRIDQTHLGVARGAANARARPSDSWRRGGASWANCPLKGVAVDRRSFGIDTPNLRVLYLATTGPRARGRISWSAYETPRPQDTWDDSRHLGSEDRTDGADNVRKRREER